MEPRGLGGYVAERLLSASLVVPCFGYALHEPNAYDFLTYWTLLLHCCYFSVDKASPHAKFLTRLLHGTSMVGAFAVGIGYSAMALAGMIHWGSWSAWTSQITVTAGHTPRPFLFQAIEKSWEHAWPVIAHVVDCRCNHASLRRCYAGAWRFSSMLFAIASYLVFGLCWEQMTVRAKGGDVFSQYALHPGLRTPAVASLLNVPKEWVVGLPDDFIFSNGQKVLMIAGSGIGYRLLTAPLFKTKRQ